MGSKTDIVTFERWLIGKGRYVDAYASLCRLRHSKLQAARDLFLIHALLQVS